MLKVKLHLRGCRDHFLTDFDHGKAEGRSHGSRATGHQDMEALLLGPTTASPLGGVEAEHQPQASSLELLGVAKLKFKIQLH